jgi:DNA-binding XRE family transcriptional regulator
MVGSDLKMWRKRWSITQIDLAKMLGTYQVTIARWETGTRKIPFLLPLALEALENRLKKGDRDGFIGRVPGVQKAEQPKG